MEVTAMGGAERLLEEEQAFDDSLELIATELRMPLDVIKVSAEGLAQELRATAGDPTDIVAAEALIHSAEKMGRIVQALIQASRAVDF
jgi:nitrogen fixation/metabolism regulation signal transduction histidine kinase